MTASAFGQGIDEFNRQQFYACHDTLEALWMESAEPEKTFYQGILQIAVACYHLENNNWRGDPQALPAVLEAMKSNQEHPHAHLDRSICSLPKILKSHPVL